MSLTPVTRIYFRPEPAAEWHKVELLRELPGHLPALPEGAFISINPGKSRKGSYRVAACSVVINDAAGECALVFDVEDPDAKWRRLEAERRDRRDMAPGGRER